MAKGCALSKHQQYFNVGARKKELIFYKKIMLMGNRTRDLSVNKILPYQLSHKGIPYARDH